MAVEITTIQNKQLRAAAEKADTQGQNSYNGRIDYSEIPVFMQTAKNSNCSVDEILGLVRQVEVKATEKNVQLKVEQMENIQKIEIQLKEAKKELAEAEAKLEDIKPNLWESASTATKTGTIIGGVAGVGLGLGLAATLSIGFSPLALLVGSACVLAGACAGAFDGMFIGAMINNETPYEATVADKKAKEYELDVVKPTKIKVRELEKSLAIALEAFNS